MTSVTMLAALALSCAKPSLPPATDASQDPTADPARTAVDAGSGAQAAPPAETKAAAPVKEDLGSYLKAHLPPGGAVEEAPEPGKFRLIHTASGSDTYATIAGAYVELTEIYAARDLEKAIQKKNPQLAAGAKIEIPEPLTSVPGDPQSERLGWPEDKNIRALFSTGAYAQVRWVDLLDRAQSRGFNGIILDAKDYMGPVNYPSKAKIALETGAADKPKIPNLARAIRFAHQRGIRIILRIPCFHDPVADKKLKDSRLSIRHASGTIPIHIDWIDPTNIEAQDYAIELAKEGIEAGADEINLDYVRFPVHLGPKVAKLPDPSTRSKIIRDFVKRVHAVTKPAGVMLSLDLFGVAATGDKNDIDKLGQEIAVVGPEAEAIMPMVYPSHYDKGYNGWDKPGDHPEIVGIGTKAAVAQLKKAKADTVVRSWLQAFPWRVTNYGSKYVVDQAKSAESNGGAGWAMWSPGCEYSAVWNGFPAVRKGDEPKAPPAAGAKKGGVAAK